MRISAILSLAFIGLVSASTGTTRKKANEYRSDDCSGPLNYRHVNHDLRQVTMDDTTNSVYITGRFNGYDGKSGDGGHCTGKAIKLMNKGCNNLNYDGKRIKCVGLEALDPYAWSTPSYD